MFSLLHTFFLKSGFVNLRLILIIVSFYEFVRGKIGLKAEYGQFAKQISPIKGAGKWGRRLRQVWHVKHAGFPLVVLFLKSMHSFDGKHCTKCLTLIKLSNYVFSSQTICSWNNLIIHSHHSTATTQRWVEHKTCTATSLHLSILKSKPVHNTINPNSTTVSVPQPLEIQAAYTTWLQERRYFSEKKLNHFTYNIDYIIHLHFLIYLFIRDSKAFFM